MWCLRAALTIKRLTNLIAIAAASNIPYQVRMICFNTDFFAIGVNTYALVIMGNCLDQFKDLKLHNGKEDTEVEGIKEGWEIKGICTFKFYIDNDGGVHLIKIPNSKYIPELKMCLLLTHYWAQEAQDKFPFPKRAKMEEDDEALMLIWTQRNQRQTILYHPLTNMPSFRTALGSRTYWTFVALCKAAEA
jgi:hypothetical protein